MRRDRPAPTCGCCCSGAAAWAGARAGCGGLGVVGARRRRGRRRGRAVRRRLVGRRAHASLGRAAGLVAARRRCACCGIDQVGRSPVAALAAERAAVRWSARVTSDPRRRGRPVRRPRSLLRGSSVREVTGRGSTYAAGDAGAGARRRATGSTSGSAAPCATSGRLVAGRRADLAAVLAARGAARGASAAPDVWWRGAAAVRASIRDAVAAPTAPTSGRWCRRWSTATTPAWTRRWRTTSAPPG